MSKTDPLIAGGVGFRLVTDANGEAPKANSPIELTEAGSLMSVSDEHPQKAISPICSICDDSLMSDNDEHHEKAHTPIEVTDSGKTTSVSKSHAKNNPESISVIFA